MIESLSVFWIWSGFAFWLVLKSRALWGVFVSHFLLESLILAQDERWRRA
jgi:hypothetical protein